MKEEWLMPGAVVPVDAETTAALVSEIKRLIGVVGSIALSAQPAKQRHIAYVCPQCHWTLEEQPAQQEHKPWCASLSSLMFKAKRPCDCKRVPLPPPQRKPWVGLTDAEIARVVSLAGFAPDWAEANIATQIVRVCQDMLKEKNA